MAVCLGVWQEAANTAISNINFCDLILWNWEFGIGSLIGLNVGTGKFTDRRLVL